MDITKTKFPYEFLARWKDGVFVGSHIIFIEQVSEGGTVLAERQGEPLVVSDSAATGFPIDQVLQQLHVDALRAADQWRTDAEAMRMQLAESQQALRERDAELAHAKTEIARLKAEGEGLAAEVQKLRTPGPASQDAPGA